MKKQQLNRNIFLGIFCIVVAFTAMAFKDSTGVTKQSRTVKLDTVPKNNSSDFDIEINMKDIDQTIKKSMEAAEKSMKEIDMNKISGQIKQSMNGVDLAKMQLQMEKSMKQVDWDKMKNEIDKSMKALDLDKMKVDIGKMKSDIDLSLKAVNTEELKKSIGEMKKINFDDLKKEMEKVKSEMELNKDQFTPAMDKFRDEMDKLKVEMQQVKGNLSDVKDMTNEMEKDGLINKKETNNIEFKDKDLYINGKKQSPEVTEKYRKYLKGDSFKFKFNGN